MARGKLLSLVIGNMHGGKTETLIKKLRRHEKFHHRKVLCFKPREARGGSRDFIESRDEDEKITGQFPAMQFPGSKPEEILRIIGQLISRGEKEPEVVGIDEFQFCSDEAVEVVNKLLEMGCDVIIAGLVLNFRGKLFGPTHKLVAFVEDNDQIVIEMPVCNKCKKNPAPLPQRLINGTPAHYDEPEVAVEDKNSDEKKKKVVTYEARCYECHELPGRPF